VGSYPNFKLKLRRPNQSVQKPQIEDDPNGRRPENIKCRISQQPLVGSYPNLKLKLRGLNQSVHKPQIEYDQNGRRPQNIK
jgi:hypothetical protein